MKRLVYLPLIGLIFSLVSCQGAMTEEEIIAKAAKIHEKVFTIDTHCDTPMKLGNYDMGVKHDSRQGGGKIDYPRMKEGGLDAEFFAVFIGQGERSDEAHARVKERALKVFANIHKSIEDNPDLVELALTPDDAHRIERAGKRAAFISMENGYPIGTDIKNIEEFYKLGARCITLSHSGNNDICDSSSGEAEHNGLSKFGKLVIKEFNRLGIIIDVSHISDKSFYDVIELSEAPVIASHSNAYALCNSSRNIKDDMLKKLAENGGVIQMCPLSSFVKDFPPNLERDEARKALGEKYGNWRELSDEDRQAYRTESREIDKKFPRPSATLSDFVDHIDHVKEVAGINHIGIGSDFDGGGGIEGMYDVSEMGNITVELVRRGYTKEEIRKIWGENTMRVMREVQTLAEKK
ncbi:membrane dipeptidase [Bacteroidota bacterium]